MPSLRGSSAYGLSVGPDLYKDHVAHTELFFIFLKKTLCSILFSIDNT